MFLSLLRKQFNFFNVKIINTKKSLIKIKKDFSVHLLTYRKKKIFI